ncbi:hypothetical protein QYE76_017398 [Lolium multiflorum]|uniref:Gag-pol polyprotein n=1 Tax=Lolium multiflorum TaxID=4521 RepID=A0AAD8Q5D3_LOLMU|nr:hypothetical protein QYE76_017398 [Lolium multiflorum]
MVGRGRPPPPPQVARDEGIRPRRRNMEDEENMYGKLKFNMPKFKGEDDAEAYLSWALKVDKIFRIHNYSGAKKVAMASLEFEDYANTWWEQVVTLREEKGDPPIDTWEDMKEEMQARFVPTHYKTDLFNKLQKLKQGTKTVEEFFKEMELTMMRANIQESENQTIARFFNGLNYPIKKIVEFQPYSNMVELVHQASKAERQVNEDIKYSKSKQYFASKLATSTPTTSVKPSASSTPSKQPSIQSRMKQTVSSTASSKASTGPSNVTCFKCGTQGHKSFECKNTKVMITMENGDIETLSEGEYEALVQAAVANEEDYDEESGEDPLLCTHDPSPSLVVTRVLTTQPQAMEDQRCNIFQTRAGIGGKSIKVIIDGGSCHNLASTELCEKLNLTLRKHPHPYHVQWLSDKGNVKIQHTVTVNFKIGPYEDTVECDVVPMTVCHMLLGRPWQFDKKAIHDGFSNAYTFKVKDKKFELRPMTPSQIIADNAKALARAQHHIHHSELRGEGATHQKESERHHPHMSERKSVLLTTKSEWREVKDNPSTTIHYVLICKGLSAETNDLTNIPSSLLSLLKEFQDVFPDELPHGLPPLRGIEHRIDLIPGAPLPNRAAYRTNPEDTKEIQRQIQDLLAKGEVVRLHGIPASIVSDRDVKFMSYLWKSLMAKFGVKLLFSSSSHPQTDGQTEVVNRSLSTLLRTLVKKNLKSWEDCIPHAEFAYNRAKHSTTLRSPFMVVYGFEPPTALDILPLPLHQRTNMDFDERTTAMKKLHEETRATIQDHVLRQANRLNAKKKERVFEEGDLVWVHLRKERFPQERNSKLKPRGDGPFKVLKRINNNAYVIDIPTSKYLVSNTFNISDLSPHHGDEEEQESRTTLSQGGGDDVAPLTNDSTSRPTSPPSGPMTRARVKALHDKVNSLLTSLDLDTPLDGMLPHAETLCVIRYVEHQDHGEDVTPWSREGEEQLSKKMYTELDPKSPEERKEEKTDGRSRTRSDRAPDRATRLRIRSTGRLTGPPGSQPGYQPVPSGQHPGASGPRPVGARSQARSGPDRPVTGPRRLRALSAVESAESRRSFAGPPTSLHGVLRVLNSSEPPHQNLVAGDSGHRGHHSDIFCNSASNLRANHGNAHLFRPPTLAPVQLDPTKDSGKDTEGTSAIRESFREEQQRGKEEVAAKKSKACKRDSESKGKWWPCTTTDTELNNLEAEGFLKPKSWRTIPGSLVPAPEAGEIVVTKALVERGFSFPPSDFFSEILKVYGLQPHNISPNSILAITNHATLCEGHLRIPPELPLFQYFFSVKKEKIPKASKLATCGSINFMLRPGRVYPPTDHHESARYWSGGFFYLKDVSDPASERVLPPFKNSPASENPAWT